MASLIELQDRIDAFLTERARWQQALQLGAPTGSRRALYQDHPELADPETFRRIDEALASEKTQARFHPTLHRLRAFLFDTRVEAAGAEALEAADALDAGGQVQLAHEALPLRDALAQMRGSANRERRALLQQAAARLLRENDAPDARAIDLSLEVYRALDFPDAAAALQAVHGVDEKAWTLAATSTLEATQDAYRDLLAYVLKKLDPKLRPGHEAQWHDLLFAHTTPWLRGELSLGDVSRAAEAWLAQLGFHSTAAGRVSLDFAAASNRAPEPAVVRHRVPGALSVLLRPSGGLGDALDFLASLGEAQAAANVSAELAVDARRLGDVSVPLGHGQLFARLLTDEGWLRRYLSLGKADAREGARMAAFFTLAKLREACAALTFEATLRERGPSLAAQEDFAERMSAALGVFVPGSFAWRVRRVAPHPAFRLRASALAAGLTRSLQERHDEDFYRNPEAGRALHALFGRGQREDAEALSRELTGAPLELSSAAARLVAVLGA